MNLWLQAIHLLSASRKGIGSTPLLRFLGVTLNTAWFMSHRIREAMRRDRSRGIGSGGGLVEIDGTFIGKDRCIKPKGEKTGRGCAHKHALRTQLDRTSSHAKAMVGLRRGPSALAG